MSSSAKSDRQPPDTALRLQAARAGSGEALGQLLDTCRQYLLLVANQQLPSDVQGKVGPSDLVQETFLKAHRHFARFHGHSEEELRAWLRQILLNTLANVLRQYRLTGSREVGREVGLETEDPVGALEIGVPDEAPTPGAGLVAEEEAEALRRALARLPEDYRQVLQWRNWERRPFEEIGRQLGRSPEAARKLWGRAVDRLSQILEGPHGP